MSDFQSLGLAAPILRALTEEGYGTPTPIQLKAIPDVLAGRDLQGIAQTGTGKTAAFALPMLHRLSSTKASVAPRSCRALVLSPTRELASQIAESFQAYGRHLRLTVTAVFGGVPIGRQQRILARGVDVLVATPGRLLDLVDQRSLNLRDVEILVLDEADQMLDLGFIHALRRLVTLVPRERQTLFFSATMPKAIETLSAQFITNPVKVAVAPVATTAERVDQTVMFVSTANKPSLLRHILKEAAIERALVFTRTKHGADRVVSQLDRAGISAVAIHGNKSQGQRERALGDFKAGRSPILVATDIAARGIDVEAVSHVINFDLPNVPESYVHRIGRTARAGAEGQAISFCNGEERAYLRDIEKLTRRQIPVAPLPAGLEPLEAAPERLPASTAPRGRRNGSPAGRPGSNGPRPDRFANGGQRGSEHGGGSGRSAPRRQSADERAGPGRPGGNHQRRPAARPGNGDDGRSVGWLNR